MKKYILIPFTFILFWSCTKTIDFEDAETDKQVTINCIMYPDSSLQALIVNTRSVLSGYNYTLITDASVALYEDGTEIGQLEEDGGYYKASNIKPQAGKTYQLKVIANGKQLEATTQIPLAADISSIDTATVEDEWGHKKINIDLTFNNNTQDDYYRVVIMQERLSSYTDQNDSIIYSIRKNPYSFEADDPVFKNLYNNFGGDELDIGPENDYRIFSDDFFNGKEYTLQFQMPGFNTSNNYGYNQNIIYEKYTIHFQKISSDLFNYLKYLNLYDYYSDNPFSEPVQVYSNIENGTGIVAGFNDDVKLTYEHTYIPYSMDTIPISDNGYFYYGY